MPNSFAFQKKFSEARHSPVSMGSRRKLFVEQKWQAEHSVLDSDGYEIGTQTKTLPPGFRTLSGHKSYEALP
jgi:hypothetical protein